MAKCLLKFDTRHYDCLVEKRLQAIVLTTQRFAMSEYGYANVRDVLLGKTNKLTKAENPD